jgi:dTDP-4-dehydrorhamnose reductase
VRVLVTGAAGQVGSALLHIAPPQAKVRGLDSQQLDITDAAAVTAAVAAWRPQVIINAAAYTAVDKAETERVQAAAVNVEGPAHLAQAARVIEGCRLIHISTDYVFDGHATAAYQPADAPHPLSVYGATKLAGEQAVLERLSDRAVVLRTAWVYATRGKNFLLTMLRLMRECGAVRVVADQRGTPTAAASIACALWRIAELPHVQGVLHWTDGGVASWYEFASAIAQDALAAGLLSQAVQVTPITTADYPTAAHRPANSVLDTREAVAQLGMEPEHWRRNLRATLAELQRN